MNARQIEARSARIDEYAINIRSFVNRADAAQHADGCHWYPMAGRIASAIADEYGIDVHRVAAAIAALSPRNPWSWNVQDAAALSSFVIHGGALPKVTTFNSNRDNAIAFLTGEHDWTSTALKVRSFVANITGDADAVTVDVWAIRVATDGRRDDVASDGMYMEVAEAYRIVAHELNMRPCDVQAVAWLVARSDNRWARNTRHADVIKRGTFAFISSLLAA